MEPREIATRTPTLWICRKATRPEALARACGQSCVVIDPRHAQKHHAREPGDLQGVSAPTGSRPVREGDSRTAGMYALEESDHAIVPMKWLNKEG